jgi:hypothetical protein
MKMLSSPKITSAGGIGRVIKDASFAIHLKVLNTYSLIVIWLDTFGV